MLEIGSVIDGKYKIQDIVAAEFEITNETNKK